MNCKPGDMAWYCGIERAHQGKIVRVVGPSKIPTPLGAIPGHYWEIDPPLFHGRTQSHYCADSALRPIRNPGDDAVDETLLWLPVPETEAA